MERNENTRLNNTEDLEKKLMGGKLREEMNYGESNLGAVQVWRKCIVRCWNPARKVKIKNWQSIYEKEVEEDIYTSQTGQRKQEWLLEAMRWSEPRQKGSQSGLAQQELSHLFSEQKYWRSSGQKRVKLRRFVSVNQSQQRTCKGCQGAPHQPTTARHDRRLHHPMDTQP